MIIREVTPSISALRGAAAVVQEPCPFILGSGMQIGSFGRYSFVGCDPFCILRAKDGNVTVRGEGACSASGDPFDVLEDLLSRYELPYCEKPAPLGAGLIGYLAYDVGQYLERLPRTTIDDIGVPDILMGAYDAVYAYDHKYDKGYVISSGLPERGEAGRRRAEDRAAWLASLIQSEPMVRAAGAATQDRKPERTFTRTEYLRAVAQAIEYVYAGDIFQVNLSQRFDASLDIPAWELYVRLHERNPAPFSAYLDFGEMQVVSASPERFVRAWGRDIQTRPIKGTRPRGDTMQEDRRLARELIASAKDRAELTMIVDLERNDFGRVCEFGSVRVPDLFTLETYPTVHHLVGTVTGRLREDKTYVDLFRASLPGGSITGAPKVRSMEIIDELEPTQRAVYTGSIGYVGFDWQMDLNIVIRTFIVANGRAYWQVGGGIVADSSPEAEYVETLDKGLALAEVLGFKICD